jgi:hypothetical protein
LIGNLYRPGTLYTRETVATLDHDFPSLAEGVVIPHGLYDLQHNQGYVTLGTSHDTSAFACDSLRQWWQTHGRALYPSADSLLLLCDGGGSNSARTYLFNPTTSLVWPTIRRIHRSTTRSSIACFRI